MELDHSHSTNWEPIQIVSIEKKSENQSKYVLNYRSLEEVFRPIKELPVVIIPVVGPSQQGKSFILNYMIRFLSDLKNTDWIGKNDEPLKGFGWKSDVDPQTLGLWISKPFILNSKDKDMAVLLMDTQGVFDEFSDQRDWSTIVGISLLMSSCLVFNIFTHLQEDVLISLESFLEYGLMAVSSDPNSEEKPFQSLMFLIRDWNTPNQFKYGLNGGKAFLDRKLELKNNQSHSAQVVRKLLNKSFNDISCFLMPNIGDKAEEEDFNGSVDALHHRFVDNLRDFISHLLNPEELKPKTIDNNIITGEELLQYFKTYVQVFNSEEMPKPIDLVEATAKTIDLILLNKLKESNLSEMRTFIQTKPFVSRKSLIEEFTRLKSHTIETFVALKKSTANEIFKELYELIDNCLNTNYEQICIENESRRIKFVDRVLEKCRTNFEDLLNGVLDFKPAQEAQVFDDYLRKFKKQILNEFTESFGDEDEQLFARDVNKFNKEMNSLENSFRAENHRRISDAKRINTKAVDEAIDLYKISMKDILENNVYLTEQVFRQFEKECEKKTRQYLKHNSSNSSPELYQMFVLEFEQKFREVKQNFKQQNRLKCETLEMNTEKLLITFVDQYIRKMNHLFDSFTSVEDLKESHTKLKKESLDRFKYSFPNKNQKLVEYIDRFDIEINKSFNELKKRFTQRFLDLQNSFSAKVVAAKDTYIRQMDANINGFVLSDHQLRQLHEKFRNEAIVVFEKHSIPVTNGFDAEKYCIDLRHNISNEFEKYVKKNQINRVLKQRDIKDIAEEYIISYDQQMEAHLALADSPTEMFVKHTQIKSKLLSEYKPKILSTNVLEFEIYVSKLEDKFDESYKRAMELLELRLISEDSVTKYLITGATNFFHEEIFRYFPKNTFLSKENLMKNKELVLKRTVDRFESERGVMSLGKYKRLIENSIKDIFKKIESTQICCRFCGATGYTGVLQVLNVCNEAECQEYARYACFKVLSCGHQCSGIATELSCLPCLRGCDRDQLKQDVKHCMICMCEDLCCAPAIQLKCGHIFHQHCTKAVLLNRWSGPRITFTFYLCPICKTPIEHSSLEDTLLPIKTLYEDVVRKGLIRLQYEGLYQNQTDFTNFALNKYSYYVCFKCKKAYYGGEARCDAQLAVDDNYDPSELVCGLCSDVLSAQACQKHGNEFLAYKCRYCCSVATFFCGGLTHYCNACHGYRPPIMPNCPAGPRGLQLEGDKCPLGLKHPPNGEEFALGCGVCLNELTF